MGLIPSINEIFPFVWIDERKLTKLLIFHDEIFIQKRIICFINQFVAYICRLDIYTRIVYNSRILTIHATRVVEMDYDNC